jgi:hypothetical protein
MLSLNSALGDKPRALAHILDSLVRVSRRVDKRHFIACVLRARQGVRQGLVPTRWRSWSVPVPRGCLQGLICGVGACHRNGFLGQVSGSSGSHLWRERQSRQSAEAARIPITTAEFSALTSDYGVTNWPPKV